MSQSQTSVNPDPAVSNTSVPAVSEPASQGGLSYDTKTLIVVITLVTVYPVGVILMFLWMKWRTWIKILILLPVSIFFILPILGILAAVILVAVNPAAQIKKANCVKECQLAPDKQPCIQRCISAPAYNAIPVRTD